MDSDLNLRSDLSQRLWMCCLSDSNISTSCLPPAHSDLSDTSICITKWDATFPKMFPDEISDRVAHITWQLSFSTDRTWVFLPICFREMLTHLAFHLCLQHPGDQALVLLDHGLQPGVLVLPLVARPIPEIQSIESWTSICKKYHFTWKGFPWLRQATSLCRPSPCSWWGRGSCRAPAWTPRSCTPSSPSPAITTHHSLGNTNNLTSSTHSPDAIISSMNFCGHLLYGHLDVVHPLDHLADPRVVYILDERVVLAPERHLGNWKKKTIKDWKT